MYTIVLTHPLQRSALIRGLLFFLAGGMLSGVATAASFTALGVLADSDTNSLARAVSRDGTWVAGTVSHISGTTEAFRWSAAAGMQRLEGLAGQIGSRAFAISGDGQVITGSSGTQPFVWTPANGMFDIGLLPNTQCGSARGISADGSVVVGVTEGHCGNHNGNPFSWTQSGGMVQIPGVLRGEALGISEDGSVIVGYSRDRRTGEVQAFRRGGDGVIQGLGFLEGGTDSVAEAVSTDGSVVVGFSAIGGPFRWTEADGMQPLGFLPGFSGSEAIDVSGDGSLVVGESTVLESQGYRSEAFIWDATNGMGSLHTILSNEFGFNLSGWSLLVANAISHDGSTIVGDGIDPEGKSRGWVVNLSPSKPTLRITRFANAVVLSWPVAFSNLTLRSGADLPANDSWITLSDPRFVRLDQCVVTNSVSTDRRFYLLQSP